MKRHHKQKNSLDGNSSTDVSTEDLYIPPPTPVVALVKSRSLESLKDALKDHEQYKEEVKVRHFNIILMLCNMFFSVYFLFTTLRAEMFVGFGRVFFRNNARFP